MSDLGAFVIEEPIPERELRARYAAWMLARCSGGQVEAARRLGVAIQTFRRWLPAELARSSSTAGSAGPGRGRKPAAERGESAAKARMYLEQLKGRPAVPDHFALKDRFD